MRVGERRRTPIIDGLFNQISLVTLFNLKPQTLNHPKQIRATFGGYILHPCVELPSILYVYLNMSNQKTILLFSLIALSEALSVGTNVPRGAQSTGLNGMVSRSQFLGAAAAAAITMTPISDALAKEVDPALKGTKQDPEYQTCISTCVYECTKPKGAETKLRQECIPECKAKCATTKQQLMVGTPTPK
mmetsp:Transcript_5447/g.8347  ORF Transcript_5447/g.8347 Transcript_5447/m.8347 type:complete len:189 (+) Transcript_5447:71-637(+)